jgi:hypothetical protein
MEERMPYVVNWDSVGIGDAHTLPMGDPFLTYETEIRSLLSRE